MLNFVHSFVTLKAEYKEGKKKFRSREPYRKSKWTSLSLSLSSLLTRFSFFYLYIPFQPKKICKQSSNRTRKQRIFKFKQKKKKGWSKQLTASKETTAVGYIQIARICLHNCIFFFIYSMWALSLPKNCSHSVPFFTIYILYTMLIETPDFHYKHQTQQISKPLIQILHKHLPRLTIPSANKNHNSKAFNLFTKTIPRAPLGPNRGKVRSKIHYEWIENVLEVGSPVEEIWSWFVSIFMPPPYYWMFSIPQ